MSVEPNTRLAGVRAGGMAAAAAWVMMVALAQGAGLAGAPAAMAQQSAPEAAAGTAPGSAPDAEPGEEPETAPPGSATQETVTVYGTLNPLPVFDYPGQVTVISRDEIELIGPSTVSDMLRDVPGMEFSGGPRRTGEVPAIRGFGGRNVLILLDGARQSFESGHDGRFFVDPELIKSAEVVRGPASALYGSGAVGGVLAFETIDAADMLEDGETAALRARLGWQEVNQEFLASLTGVAQLGSVGIVASIGSRDSGDIALGSGVDLTSDDDIVTSLVKGTWAVTPALELEASWSRFRNDLIEPNNGQGAGGPTPGNPDVEKDITSDTLRASARYAPTGIAWLDLTATVYRIETAVDEFDPSIARSFGRTVETTGVSARNVATFDFDGAEIFLTIGLDWYRDEQDGFDSTGAGGVRPGVPDATSTFFGAFAQIEARIDRPFGLPGDAVIVPGVRYDAFTNESDLGANNEDERFSPRIAASYGPVEWFRIFASWSEAFRAPGVNELYLTGVHFPVPHPVLFAPPFSLVFVNNNFVPNPGLVPETSRTLELGAGFDFRDVLFAGDRFQAKGSWYRSEVEDLINLSVNFAFSPTCFVPPFFRPCNAGTTNAANVADAELTGVEIEAIYDAPRFRLRATWSEIDGENTATGADLGVLTPDRFTLDARLKLYEWDAALGARLQLASDYERRGLVGGALAVVEARDAYEVVDIYASWSPSFLPGLRIDAGVDNLFDEDYERVFAGVSEPGRNPKVAVSWRVGF